MNNVRKRLIHLHHCHGIGWKGMYTLLKYDSTLQSIFKLSQPALQNILQLPAKNISTFYQDLQSDITQIMNKYEEMQIRMITILDEEYPLILKEIYDPPFVLYMKGNVNLLNVQKKLSVIGSRTPSLYGINCINRILPQIIQNGWVIVSGFARGIDSLAHKCAIKENGRTIAVLGGGFAHLYPPENKKLADEMSYDHLIISEYPLDVRPEKWHFPMRNRIISGLSYGTLIIEAKEHSGSLITAELALQQGRDVFAIPGSILEKNFVGTNKLIQQGAKLVLNSDDILHELNWLHVENTVK